MPSSATITSFHTFTANTKARSSQVNTNFMNFRGHMVPINTDTVSCSNITHDLGSTEHRWRSAYVESIDFNTSTSTASVVAQAVTSVTTGAYVIKIGGVEKFRVDTGGISLASLRGEALTALTSTGFTSNGTWTCPADVKWAIVMAYGGGGGGAGSNAGGSNEGRGGGQGCLLDCRLVLVTPGNSYSITIGSGGAGVTGIGADTDGGNGGDTKFGTLETFLGGEGGKYIREKDRYTVYHGGRGGSSRGGQFCDGGRGGGSNGGVYDIDGEPGQSGGGYAGGAGGLAAGGKSGGGGGGAGGGGPGGQGGRDGGSGGPSGASASAISGAGGGGGCGSNGISGNGGSGWLAVYYVAHN